MLQTIHIPRSVPWLPPSLREIKGEIRCKITFSESERKILRKRKQTKPSKWAENNRIVTMSVLPGKWRNEVTPYLVGIMDASFHPSVQVIIICKPPQTGGSESILNCIGYAIDRAPGPTLFTYPDELTGKENFRDRLLPMIKSSPRLRSYMTGLDDDSSELRINLQHMPIYLAWARSASRLANKPIRYVVLEEIDKEGYATGKREAPPIRLAEARTITYRYNRKIWKISSTTTESGNIWTALTKEAQVRFEFWAKCPFCGTVQIMEFGSIKWAHKTEPDEQGKYHSEDPAKIEAEGLAWYECPHCLAEWSDYDRDQAVIHGQWRDKETGIELFEYLKQFNPVKIGFQYPSWISRFIPFAEPAACYLRGLTDIDEYKNFCNKHEAKPWKISVISKNKDQVLAARTDLPAQTVPSEAIALTAFVDVQQHGFWFVVRAWAGYITNWNIHYGFLSTWGEVENLLYETVYPVQGENRTMRIFRAGVDTGGTEKYEDMTMTEETYFWLLKNRGRGGVSLWGTKGASSAMPGKLKLGNAIMSTPKGKKLPGALRILFIDTDKAKDQFHYRLQLASNPDTRALPGAAFLHKDVGEDYVTQILAEEKRTNDKGIEEWVNPHNRPNHLLDCEIGAAACVEMEFPGGGLRLLAENLKRQNEKIKTGPAPAQQAVARSKFMSN